MYFLYNILYCIYAVEAEEFTILISHCPMIMLSVLLNIICYVNSKERTFILKLFIFAFGFTIAAMILSPNIVDGSRTYFLGFISNIPQMLFYSFSYDKFKLMATTYSVLHFSLYIFSCLIWFLYGKINNNIFIFLPFCLVGISGVVELIIHLVLAQSDPNTLPR